MSERVGYWIKLSRYKLSKFNHGTFVKVFHNNRIIEAKFNLSPDCEYWFTDESGNEIVPAYYTHWGTLLVTPDVNQ